jgi:hypothetical protein
MFSPIGRRASTSTLSTKEKQIFRALFSKVLVNLEVLAYQYQESSWVEIENIAASCVMFMKGIPVSFVIT